MAWHKKLLYLLQMVPLRLLLFVLRPFSDRRRGAILAWFGRRVILNTPSLSRRITDNLARVFPLESPQVRDAILRDNAGKIARNMLEMLDNDRLLAIKGDMEVVDSPGYRALLEAQKAGTGTILIGGHYGRFDAVRAALLHRGIEVGAVYRPQNNPYYNADLLHHFRKVGEPMFPRGRAGMRTLIKHLKTGGVAAILIDQKTGLGEWLDFLGHPAMTSTDIAELALRYKVPLIPAYALRIGDGTNFRIELEAPVPPSDPLTMTQLVNDSLAARIRQDPTEWYWLHRRWATPVRILDKAKKGQPEG